MKYMCDNCGRTYNSDEDCDGDTCNLCEDGMMNEVEDIDYDDQDDVIEEFDDEG